MKRGLASEGSEEFLAAAYFYYHKGEAGYFVEQLIYLMYYKKINGASLGVLLKALCLLSGGIDSAVAAALALENNLELVAVHFQNYPFSDRRSEEKTKRIAEKLAKRFRKKIKLYFVPHAEAHKQILSNCTLRFGCVLCRRMMLRTASRLAEKEGCTALLTGESLGQVASQTLHNLAAEKSAAGLPIIRPLLGMDKLEIEELARKYETYKVSTSPGMCCTAVPEKPSTKAHVGQIEEEEKKLNLEELVSNAISKAVSVELGK